MFTRRADPLRQLTERLQLPSFRAVLGLPGVNEALRISLQPHQQNIPASVATLERRFGASCPMKVVYDRMDANNQRLAYDLQIPLERYQKLLAALRHNKFDTMDDEPNLPLLGVDLWLIERGAGTFRHDVVVSPQSAVGNHRELILAIRQHLPEAVRALST